MRVAVVLNPNSRKNRKGGVRADVLREALGSAGEVFVTQDERDLDDVLRDVITPELACLVSVGGDGALHWALNAARPLAAERNIPMPVVLPTNGGTIDFVARRAGVRGRAETLIPRLVRALDGGALETTELDSLEIGIAPRAGEPKSVLGFAMAAAGIGQRFFDEFYTYDDPGPLSIITVIARGVASLGAGLVPGPIGRRLGSNARRLFRPFAAQVSIDGEELPVREHGGIHVGSFGVNLGGVLRVFPFARDGAMHVQAGAITPLEMVMALPALARGGAIPSKTLRDGRGHHMTVQAISDEPIRPVIDGEIYEGIQSLDVAMGPRIRIAKV